MNTRIRYEKTATPGELVSVRTFAVEGNEFRVCLNCESNKFEILLLPSNQVVSEGTGASFANTKLKAKKALTVIGVDFQNEVRTKQLAATTEEHSQAS